METSQIPIPKPPYAAAGDLMGVITNISNSLLLLVGIVAVLFLILGGFQYITSAGNPENINKAKTTITYTIIGVLITLLSYAVVKFIVSQFTK